MNPHFRAELYNSDYVEVRTIRTYYTEREKEKKKVEEGRERGIVILSIAGAVLFLPSVGMYYGLHHWTSSLTGGIVDARFIAIVNTAVESPLGQVSMIPLLAWIAKNAPENMKATFFAVFASFTNLALSASALGTKYLNQAFIVTRQVKDKITNEIVTTADYS